VKGDEKLCVRKFIGVRCGVIEEPMVENWLDGFDMEFEREFKNEELKD
jgi:hypothetical protein